MSEPNKAELAFLLAESRIRQLFGRYADAVWRKDVVAFGECFTEDAVWKIAGRTLKGREEIGNAFTNSLEPSVRVMMWTGVPVLDLGVGAATGTATGRTQITELIKRKDGTSKRTLAIYYDRFVESEGIWRFQWHHFNLYYLGAPDLSDSYIECLEYGPPPAMPGADDPTSIPNR